MKKILVLFILMGFIVTLTACGGEGEAATVPTTTAPEHTHSYSSTEKPASCTEKGLETFTCACGHTYTEELPLLAHNWGEWIITAPALLNKDGTETRTCKVCSATETKVTKENAVENAFTDVELQYLFDRWNGVNGDITAAAMLSYFSQKYTGREEDPLIIPAATVFAWLEERFALTDGLKEEMKRLDDYYLKYHAATDSFELTFAGSIAEILLIGYIPNGENSYTVYYQHNAWDGTSRGDGVWAVTMEYNLPEGKPNRYLSVIKVDAVPDKVIQ